MSPNQLDDSSSLSHTVSTIGSLTGEEVNRMNVLVATTARQGEVEGDFSRAIEGELVRLPFLECDNGDSCGCTRSFVGLTSKAPTTTAIVAPQPDLNRSTYTQLLSDDLAHDLAEARLPLRPDELAEHVDEEVEHLLLMVHDQPIGAVVRRYEGWSIAYKPLPAA